MVRRNSIVASTRSSMAEIDDSELFRSSEFQANSDQADLKFLSGEYYRLVPTTSKLSAKTDSMEAKLVEIQKTLSQLCNQLGIHPIAAESSQQAPPVTYSFDSFLRDDHNRLPLDNSNSLMPEFDGSNASDWLSRVERFFSVGRYSDLAKLDLVAFSLEGDVLLWFDREMTRREFHSWDEFRRRLLLKFGAASEESSEIVAEILEEKASYTEKKLIPQYQVPISSLEPSLSFSSEPLDVSASWPSEIVSNNRVQSQSDFECVKNINNAHHVFDELLLRQHKFQQRKKPSLSPKSRMFKFKNRTLLRNWSQMDLHQVIDISKVNNLSPCFSADFGLVRKKRPFQCLRLRNLRLHKQAHMSRFLYPMRMLHDPGGMKQLLHGDMKSIFAGLLEVIGVGTEYMMHKATVISAKLPENGLLVFPWNLMFLGCGWLIFDRGKPNLISGNVIILERASQTMLLVKAKDTHVDSLTGRIKIILSCGVIALRKQIQWAEIQQLSLYKELWIEIMDEDITKLLNIFDKLQLNLKQGMDLHGASGHRLFPRQQSSSSIWHRWRRKPLFLLHFWKKICWYQRLFFQSGLIMWGAANSWFSGSSVIYQGILGCSPKTLLVFIPFPSLRTSSFSTGRVLIQLSKR